MTETEDNQYVPADQAIKLLGEKPAKFYYHADRGEIRTETEPKPGKGKKNNRYLVTDILKVKQRLQEQRQKHREPVIIDWLYAEDVPAGLRLSQRLYPGEVNLAEAAIYQSWRKNNPHLTMAAFSEDRRDCYASVQVVPLVNEQIALDVLSGAREEASIIPDEVRSYNEPGAYTLLVTSATCLPDRPLLLYQVLRKYIAFWIDMYPERYIRRVYAQAMSESGMRIVQHFFMNWRPDLAHNAFMLDLQWPPAARMIREFKETLARKSPLPPDLQWSAMPQIPMPAPQPATASNLAPTSITQPTTRKPYSRVSQPQKQASDKHILPDEWYSVPAFAERHGIAASTAKKAITSGRLQSEHNDWLSGKAPVKNAFNPEQQSAFIHYYRDERPNENFHPCDVPGCPCHQAQNREP